MRRAFPWSAIVLALVSAFAACRSTAPAGNEAPIAPLGSVGESAVIAELNRRLASVHAVRSLMRVRATTATATQSFRAQLIVEPSAGRMELIAYTPVGTSAMTLFADGENAIFLDHINNTAWKGTTAELARSVGYFDPSATPAAWALDVLGFAGSGEFEPGAAGLRSIRLGAVAMTFDPPSFPPRGVTVMRGNDRLEVTHLETVSTDASIQAPAVPRGYRCCVAPRI